MRASEPPGSVRSRVVPPWISFFVVMLGSPGIAMGLLWNIGEFRAVRMSNLLAGHVTHVGVLLGSVNAACGSSGADAVSGITAASRSWGAAIDIVAGVVIELI